MRNWVLSNHAKNTKSNCPKLSSTAFRKSSCLPYFELSFLESSTWVLVFMAGGIKKELVWVNFSIGFKPCCICKILPVSLRIWKSALFSVTSRWRWRVVGLPPWVCGADRGSVKTLNWVHKIRHFLAECRTPCMNLWLPKISTLP